MARWESRLKRILARCGLVSPEPLDIGALIDHARPHISPDLQGEAVLTIGSALSEVASRACGVIAIGPFGCMPNRLSEAILSEAMTRDGKLASSPGDALLRRRLGDLQSLPFLAIESDGSPFPQLITAKLESFCLRAGRLHRRMMQADS
jgi:hypothetical protein